MSDTQVLQAELDNAMNSLDDYGRTNPDIQAACSAAVSDANVWRMRAVNAERENERLIALLREVYEIFTDNARREELRNPKALLNRILAIAMDEKS